MKEGLGSGNGKLGKDAVPLNYYNGDKMRRNFGSPSKQRDFGNKDRKRPRLVKSESDSDSDTSLFFSPQRKFVYGNNEISNGSVGRDSRIDSYSGMARTKADRKSIKSEPVRYREDNSTLFWKPDNGVGGGKRSGGLDVFGYYDEDAKLVDRKKKVLEYSDDDDDDDSDEEMGGNKVLGSKYFETRGKWKEFDSESSRDIMVNNGDSKFYGNMHFSSVENNRRADIFDKQKYKTKADSFGLVSSLRRKFEAPRDMPIRIQGKNGVLKLMIRDNKKVDGFDTSYGHVGTKENRKAYRSAGTSNLKPQLHLPAYEEKFLHNSMKNQTNSSKPSSGRCISHNYSSEDSDTSLPPGSSSLKTYSIKKDGRNKVDSNLASEPCLLPRRKVGEVRRGTGTQKQLLRDQIRKMLEEAGWKIEFRPRKNRNYQDAVYTNPSGTEYWSILNAYYAHQKQWEEQSSDLKKSGAGISFTPIAEEVLSQLTRQTCKKLERENMKLQRASGGSTNGVETSKRKYTRHKHVKNIMSTNEETPYVRENGELVKVKREENGSPIESSKAYTKKQKSSFASSAHLLQRRKTKKQNRCALLVRSSKKGANEDENGVIQCKGRLTILSWLIDSGIVSSSEKVKYMNKKRTQTLLEGWITRDGIHCACCSKILTVLKFEIHSGSKLRQPYQNICVESGDSLLQCQLDAWGRQEEFERRGFWSVDVNGDGPNDDTCGICADGGDLICCDGCPSTFHQSCLDIQVLPQGDWHCSSCSCKFCGSSGGNCQRDHNGDIEMLTCSLCEEKYHTLCTQQTDTVVVDLNASCNYFCGLKCRELFEQLQKLLWVKHELEAGFSWTLIRRCDLDSNTSSLGLSRMAECNSKLAVALTVMNECFFPIIDRRSGINLIHNVIYNCGSNFNRLNYSGFYAAVLERGDEIISAASIRIHGTRLAEMPYIGTRHIYRRQGMCRRLLNSIESALCSLKVEKLIIPAISELMNAWTTVFGFKALEESDKRGIRSLNMLVFPGTDLLQKLLLTNNLSERQTTDHTDMDVVEPTRNDHLPSERIGKPEPHSSTTPVNVAFDESVQDGHDMKTEAVSVQTCFQAPEVPECYYEPDDMLPTSAPETIGLQSSLILHDKLEVKNELILETAEHDIKCSVVALGDVDEVKAVTIPDVQTRIHSLDNRQNTESVPQEESHVPDDEAT